MFNMLQHKIRAIITILIAVAAIIGLAGFINLLIESEQGENGGIQPVDAYVIFAALCALVAIFIIARILRTGTAFGLVIPERFRTLAAVGLLILLPQSAVLYGRIAQTVTSEITLFAVYNILDIAFGRLLLALFQKRLSLLPAKDGEDQRADGKPVLTDSPGRSREPSVRELLNRETIERTLSHL
jgi:hypothetical protein